MRHTQPDLRIVRLFATHSTATKAPTRSNRLARCGLRFYRQSSPPPEKHAHVWASRPPCFDLSRILVIDLEATCWQGPRPPGQEHEVIEIGNAILHVADLRLEPGPEDRLPQPDRLRPYRPYLVTSTQSTRISPFPLRDNAPAPSHSSAIVPPTSSTPSR